jgi:hypothetical protein
MNDYTTLTDDDAARIAAVVRRLYTEQRMHGDAMRNAAQMLETILHRAGRPSHHPPHATYDGRLA